MPTVAQRGLDACLWLTEAIGGADQLGDIYEAALESLERALGVRRSSILLFDEAGVMRFAAWRGLSTEYRSAVEGHTPWTTDTPKPNPIVVPDVSADAELTSLAPTFAREGIAGITFIPLTSAGRVMGKFMLYYDAPGAPTAAELDLAGILAAQVAFAVERTRAQHAALHTGDRLRFVLEAAQLGTWEWDLLTDRIEWSETAERIHGFAPGTFDKSPATFERRIEHQDRARVIDSVRRAVQAGASHDVEYRVRTQSGELRWIMGTGRVEYGAGGRPLRLTGVCRNITDRKQDEFERLAGVREASRMKDEFLAVLSHELRTPLNAILGWSQLLQSGSLEPARHGEAMTIIERNARVQAQLIEQILDVSRIITGKIQLDRTPCQLAVLVETAVHAIEPAATAKGLRLTATIAPDLPAMDADPHRVLQMLGNVLANALKFTPAGGTITVEVFAREASLVIAVRDTGAGIPPEFLPYVFERFRQADASPTRQHGGLGLGLAIVRHLVDLHGGTICAESDGIDRGTSIRIELPAHTSSGAVADHHHTSIAGSADGSLAGAHVLIVDDEADARELLAAVFTAQGAVVSEASSVEEAVERLTEAEGPIELLVADIGMPVRDGFDLIETLRRDHHPVRAIALTAYARPEDRTRALHAGFDAFIAKPFDPPALIRISAALRTDRSAFRPTTAVSRSA